MYVCYIHTYIHIIIMLSISSRDFDDFFISIILLLTIFLLMKNMTLVRILLQRYIFFF